MIEKLLDSANMFWQALDTQERMLALYVAAAILYVAAAIAAALDASSERRRAEERLARRIATLVREGV